MLSRLPQGWGKEVRKLLVATGLQELVFGKTLSISPQFSSSGLRVENEVC